MSKQIVSYIRVSTARQGKSGLGLEAQRDALARFAAADERKSRSFDHLVATGKHWLRWSFGQPGSPQSFFQSREVFGTPIRAHYVF
jgi:hypothetical protein